MKNDLIYRLTEGDGQPGFDLPSEEAEEVSIGKQIIAGLDSLMNDVSPEVEAVDSKLNEIKALAQRLIDMHSPESELPDGSVRPVADRDMVKTLREWPSPTRQKSMVNTMANWPRN